MKIKTAKFYQGVHLAGVVRTMFTGKEEWLHSAELVPNMGVLVRTKHVTSKDETLEQGVIVPFNNICYTILAEEDKKQIKPK